jgi:serine protease Do
MKSSHCLLSVIVGLLVSPAFAEAVKDREGAVRQDRSKHEQSERWKYNDTAAGFAEAKSSGKPVMVVLRCVPCLACMGIDTGVLTEGADLKPLLDQFVCVRVINANALDLAKFQFDYDLSYSVLFFNADGTVYGRYGSWKHQKNSQETAMEGFKQALNATLKLHAGYPGNKAVLQGKQPVEVPFSAPTEIPALAERYKATLDWEGKVAQSCVHCHMLGSALQTWYRKERKPMPERLIYPFPEPETIGLTLASESIAEVAVVADQSIADGAGLKVGDHLTSVNGQPLISIADLSWALHVTEDIGEMSFDVQRAGAALTLSAKLPAQWRWKSDVTRRAAVWPERGMVLGGLRLERHDGPGLGLRVLGVGQYGMHAMAKKSGFQQGDVLISMGDLSSRITEGELLGTLLSKHQGGDLVKVVIQRGDVRKELTLPMQ